MKIAVMLLAAVMGLSSCTTMNKNRLDTTKSNNKDDNKSPSLTAQKVNKVWVPEKIDGHKFIEGHYMWVLEKTTSWSHVKMKSDNQSIKIERIILDPDSVSKIKMISDQSIKELGDLVQVTQKKNRLSANPYSP